MTPSRVQKKGLDDMFSRSSGVLIHLSSLPGDYGIGSMGAEARYFIDFLERSGVTYWQLLPLVPPGDGASPYMSPSSAAGNPLFIDLPSLMEDGLLTWRDLAPNRYDEKDQVNYTWVQQNHEKLLRRAFRNASEQVRLQVDRYIDNDQELADYALFQAIRDYFGRKLVEWPDIGLIRREPEALEKYRTLLAEEVEYQKFCQYLFAKQWQALKKYANDRGIRIIGDIPFYVSLDSVDVWLRPELFQVNPVTKVPDAVAGVPGDLFTPLGQLWGNPLYQWDVHRKDGYQWWCNRVRRTAQFFDVIRIDHFRGIHSYWSVPRDTEDALKGHWCPGPGMELIDAIRQQVPQAEFIAEDLGDIDEETHRFIANSGIPGIRVLVDAFTDLEGNSAFLPHHCIEDSVMYTGTHDTPTFIQWLEHIATDAQREYAESYLRLNRQEGLNWGMLAGAWGSISSLVVAPMQDVLGLGAGARMNAPGTLGEFNWSWRVRREALNEDVSARLRRLNQLYGRMPRWIEDEE